MVIGAYKSGKKKLTHIARAGDDNIVLYFSVDMSDDNIDSFASMLGLKFEVDKFYACVSISCNSSPKTFIAYERAVDGELCEMFNISTGIPSIEIMSDGLIKEVPRND